MNLWLAAAPNAEVAHGEVGCMVSVNDLADRPPRPLQNGEVMNLGNKRLRRIETPHVPHGWDAAVPSRARAITPWRAGECGSCGVGEELAVEGVGDPPLETAQRFELGFPAACFRL